MITTNTLRAVHAFVLVLVTKTLEVNLWHGTRIICQLSCAWFISLFFRGLAWLGGGKSLGGIAASPGMFWELNIYYDSKGRPVRGVVLAVHKTFALRARL